MMRPRRLKVKGFAVVRMLDVARHAGVSETTVSHVLNGTRKVRPATADAVHRAIQALGYEPNSVAQSLARSSTRSLGVALSDLGNHYCAELVQGIEAATSARGYTLLLADTHDSPAEELQAVRELQQRRVDGILLATTEIEPNESLLHLARHETPVVLIDRLSSLLHDQVGVENRRSTAKLVAHLVALGHSRIGFLCGLDHVATSRERLEGYRSGLKSAGLAFRADLVRQGGSQTGPARVATHELLALRERPTALIAANNLMTLGAMRALHEAEMNVPNDMAVVSFDDFEWADIFSPRLTTMAQPTAEIGATAVQLLLDRIDQPDRAPRTIRLKPELRVRDSCGTRLSTSLR